LRAANLPKNVLHILANGERLPTERLQYYDLDEILPTPLEESLAQEIRDAHCNMLPEEALPGMMAVQRARDAAMAHAMADDNPAGAILIAGAGHTRKDRGVPTHFPNETAGKNILSLAFLEADPAQPDPAAYDAPYDLVWFTSAVPPIDACAEMIKRRKT
jgi:uncharacterized iron-regulated protein